MYNILINRDLSDNQLSGPIPEWIGNLIKLEEMYIYICLIN